MISRTIAVIGLMIISVTAFGQKTYYCETAITNTMDGHTQTAHGKAWMKSPTTFRMQKTVDGKTMLIISNGKDVWLESPDKKEAIHSRQPAEAIRQLTAHGRVVGNDLSGFLKTGAHKVGQTRIQGALCNIYSRTDKNGTKFTLWVQSGADKLTRREEVQATLHMPEGTKNQMKTHTFLSKTEIYNWKIGQAMPDSLFHPTSGYKILESSKGLQPAKPRKP
jgi:outer membrane lipoprotein-sorting protein